MKRIVTMAFCLSLAVSLFGCATTPAQGTSYSAKSQSSISSESEPISTPAPQKLTFDCDAETLFEQCNKAMDSDRLKIIAKYEGDSYEALMSGFTGMSGVKVIAFSMPSSPQVQALSLSYLKDINDKNAVDATKILTTSIQLCAGEECDEQMALEALKAIKVEQPQNIYSAKVQLFDRGESFQYVVYPAGTAFDVTDLPMAIEWPENAFLADPERITALKAALKLYDFADMEQQLTTFIDATQPNEDDVSYSLLAFLQNEELKAALSQCSISVDPVESKANVFYNGMKNVSQNINLFAFIKNSELTYRAGFTAGNWLFFESYQIETGAESNIYETFDYFDVEREIISGGIREYADFHSFNDDDLNEIYTSENAVMRFEDKKAEKTRDHTITQEEKDCLRSITYLNTANRELSDMLFYLETVFIQ